MNIKMKIFTKETRKKLSEAKKGKPLTMETKRKISESNKGRICPMKGNKHSDESKRKMSESHKGNKARIGCKHTEESKRKMSEAKKGLPVWNKGLTNETDERVKNGNKKRIGYKHSKKAKEKMSKSTIGENNPNWNGGSSNNPYDKEFNRTFKQTIRKRDNQICMLCNIHREKLNKPLCVHHIDYNKKNTCEENCILLCPSCHSKTNFNREEWIIFFQSLLNKKYDYDYIYEEEIK